MCARYANDKGVTAVPLHPQIMLWCDKNSNERIAPFQSRPKGLAVLVFPANTAGEQRGTNPNSHRQPYTTALDLSCLRTAARTPAASSAQAFI